MIVFVAVAMVASPEPFGAVSIQLDNLHTLNAKLNRHLATGQANRRKTVSVLNRYQYLFRRTH